MVTARTPGITHDQNPTEHDIFSLGGLGSVILSACEKKKLPEFFVSVLGPDHKDLSAT